MKLNVTKILSIAAMMGTSMALLAQETATPTPHKNGVDLVEIYRAGGWFSHIILMVGIVVVVLAIVKYSRLYLKEKIDSKNFYLKLKGYIKNQQYAEAIKVSSNFKNTTLGHIFWNGLLAFNDAKDNGKKGQELKNVLQDAFDEAGLQLIPKVEAWLYWFDILAQVATLLGLLGTIWGLIQSFSALAFAEESQKQVLLTQGIYQAMGTTGLGLIVAIPTMFIKGLLQGRADRIINEIDEYSVKTINQINYSIKD